MIPTQAPVCGVGVGCSSSWWWQSVWYYCDWFTGSQ